MNANLNVPLRATSLAAICSVLFACSGEDPGICLFGATQPEFTITVYDSVTGNELCGTLEHHIYPYWSYSGRCEYEFEKQSSRLTNITISLQGYETYTEMSVLNPEDYCVDNISSTTDVTIYLDPITDNT